MGHKIKYIFISIVFLLILGEVVFLFFVQKKPVLPSLSKSQQSLTKTPPLQNDTFGSLPIGYYVATSNNGPLLFLAQIDNVTRSTNGDIFVTATFRLNRGGGIQKQKTFLLYTNDKFIHGINLTKANALDLSIITKNKKDFHLDPLKNSDQTLNILQQYTHQKAILVFLQNVFPNSIKTLVEKSGDRLNQLLSCNRSLLEALDNSTDLPSCTPYIYNIVVYDKNI